MGKLRVLHVTKHYPPYVGGIETVCRDLCSALKNDYEQYVFCFNDKKETIDEVYDGVPVTRVAVTINVSSQPISLSYKKELYRVMRVFKPDIIHFDYPNPLASHYLLKAMKKYHFRGKFQLFWHMDIIKQKFLEPFFRKQILKMIKMSDQIIITTPNYLENTSYLPKYADKNKVVVLPLRVGDERIVVTKEQEEKAKEIREQNEGKTICFFFGRHVPYKGLSNIIEANKYLNRSKFSIYVGGTGPLTEELKQQAIGMDNIHFLGRITSDDINSYLLATDLFLFPSITRNEAFGISLAEGLWFGKPAVTFTILGSGVNWVSINNETGLEVENSNPKAYAEAMIKLSEDKVLYEKLSQGAIDRSRRYFSKESFNKAAIAIYKSM